ncbi:MAG TPA: TolC family protein [Vicinamibacterales bacterium]
MERHIMRTTTICGSVLAVFLTVFGIPVSVFAQATPAAQAPQVRRLTVDEAVRLALENNLGIQVARITPAVEDLNVAAARGAWAPTFNTTLRSASIESPSNSFLSGAQGRSISDATFLTNVGVQQALRWGGRYTIGWDSVRSTTTNLFSNFSPQLESSLALSYAQPLLRGFSIDTPRQQMLVSQKNREISDIVLRESIAATIRSVRIGYWELAFAIASLAVQRQSLELAQESLRNTRARVEIGTTPPIDIVEAQAEVALREEATIVAEAQIQSAEDALRTLIYDPDMPDFWTLRIEPADTPPFQPVVVDADMAVRNALDRRTDLQQTRKNLEATDINIQYFQNQTLPDVTASFDYGLTGLGGTQFVRGEGFPGPVIGQTQRSFGSVLGDLFGNQFPNWTASLNVSYPLGATQPEADLARARLQYTQSTTQLRNQQLQVVSEVREAARQVQTNQKRVETTRSSRQLAERRLEAEQRKFTAGTSTSFFVFQAQRDLAQARNNELRAILDHNRSAVDLETVQEAPLRVQETPLTVQEAPLTAR